MERSLGLILDAEVRQRGAVAQPDVGGGVEQARRVIGAERRGGHRRRRTFGELDDRAKVGRHGVAVTAEDVDDVDRLGPLDARVDAHDDAGVGQRGVERREPVLRLVPLQELRGDFRILGDRGRQVGDVHPVGELAQARRPGVEGAVHEHEPGPTQIGYTPQECAHGGPPLVGVVGDRDERLVEERVEPRVAPVLLAPRRKAVLGQVVGGGRASVPEPVGVVRPALVRSGGACQLGESRAGQRAPSRS